MRKKEMSHFLYSHSPTHPMCATRLCPMFATKLCSLKVGVNLLEGGGQYSVTLTFEKGGVHDPPHSYGGAAPASSSLIRNTAP